MSKLGCGLVVAIACTYNLPRITDHRTVPIEYDHGRWLVTGHVDGQPLRLVIDTGATISSLTIAAARRLNQLTTGSTTINGTRSVATSTLRALEVAGAIHTNVRVAIVDMLPTEAIGPNTDGIVGLDILADHDLVLDLVHHELALLPVHTFVTTADLESLPLVADPQGLLLTPVAIGEIIVPAIVDTGSSNSYVSPEAGAVVGTQSGAWQRHPVLLGGAPILTSFEIGQAARFVRLGYGGQPIVLLGNDVFRRRFVVVSVHDHHLWVSN